MRTYGRAIHSAQAYSMNDEFSRVLSQQMEYYSNDPNADRVSRIKGEMTQVQLLRRSPVAYSIFGDAFKTLFSSSFLCVL